MFVRRHSLTRTLRRGGFYFPGFCRWSGMPSWLRSHYQALARIAPARTPATHSAIASAVSLHQHESRTWSGVNLGTAIGADTVATEPGGTRLIGAMMGAFVCVGSGVGADSIERRSAIGSCARRRRSAFASLIFAAVSSASALDRK